MADETDSVTGSDADSGDATDTATTGAKGRRGSRPTGGANKSVKVPGPLPVLTLGARDERDQTKWVTFLQGMLNYQYQVLTVAETGDFDSDTAKVVRRFRYENGLDYGDHVDEKVWHALGVEEEQAKGKASDSDGQSSFENVHFGDVSFVDLPTEESVWAATLATVLNSNGNSYDVDSLCEQVGATNQDRKTWAEARAIGTELGMYPVACDSASPESWAGVLQHSGPLWTPVPGDEFHMIVVTGIWDDDGEIGVHVLDPVTDHAGWMEFTEFTETYGFGAGVTAELLAAA